MARSEVEELEVATVVQQQDGKVTIALPMVGFPEGFRLEPGDQVVVVDQPAGLAVRPLVQLHRVDAAATGRFNMTAQTPGANRLAAGGAVDVWTVERSGGDTGRVVAVRNANQ